MAKPTLHIGLGGWSYPEWRRTFYAGVPQRQWLAHCARTFTSVDVNATFYRLVDAKLWDRLTTDFVYVRLHSHRRLYASGHSERALAAWNTRIASWLEEGRSLYVYCNTAAAGHAPHDAERLMQSLGAERHRRVVDRAGGRGRRGTVANLTIRPETVCYVIVKAREFDVKVEPDDPDSGSNPSDDRGIDILEDLADDPTFEELSGAMGLLNDDETLDLVALTWIGRGDYTAEDWAEARDQAREIPMKDRPRYLLGTPLLGDFLEDGLSELGLSCEDYEVERL
jgi:hypothetical protein